MKAKGIGRKTAARVVLELKGALGELEALVGPSAAAAEPEDSESLTAQALSTLGYSESEAARAAKKAVEELGAEAAAGELLREALKSVK